MEGSVLDALVAGFRTNPAVGAKQELALVTQVLGASDWLHGPGDDTAVVQVGGERVLVAGEVIYPPFVEADPHGAGIAAVVTNVNDVAAMGGRPIAIVDALVGTRELAEEVLLGMREAAELYRIAIVGGHLTFTGERPHVSAFILGHAGPRVLSSAAARPGHELLFAALLDGEAREDFPFLSSVAVRGADLVDDVAVLADLAAHGHADACKDVSMGGLFGSLAMLLEPSGCGVTVDVARIRCPEGLSLTRWVTLFPSYGFLLAVPFDRVEQCHAAFSARDIDCAHLGTLDDSGEMRIALEGREQPLINVRESGFVRPPSGVPPPR